MTRKLSPYQIFIFVILGAFLIFSFWAARQASRNGSEVADADYYSKGLRYNDTLIERRAAASKGWNLTTTLEGRTLLLQLVGEAGSPVQGATGTLFLYNGKAEKPAEFPLPEVAEGRFTFAIPATLGGEMRARVDFAQDGARLSRHFLLSI